MPGFVNEPDEGWGGPWTEKKLNAFIHYVKAYLTIMNKHHWKTIYFDGFAGSGERIGKAQAGIFADLDLSDEEAFVYRGAAERVVSLAAPYLFNYYYFIEKKEADVTQLEARLKAITNEEIWERLVFRQSDCNQELAKLGEALHRRQKDLAALVFLDPFGMQIDWMSIEKLQDTRSDVWILLPTGVIVNRLLDRKAELKHLPKLEQFLGLKEPEIRERFYRQETLPTDLFGESREAIRKVEDPINKIAEVYIENMGRIWKFVTPKPLVLKNTRGVPLFHFVFASNNPSALKIANYIIQTA